MAGEKAAALTGRGNHQAPPLVPIESLSADALEVRTTKRHCSAVTAAERGRRWAALQVGVGEGVGEELALRVELSVILNVVVIERVAVGVTLLVALGVILTLGDSVGLALVVEEKDVLSEIVLLRLGDRDGVVLKLGVMLGV